MKQLKQFCINMLVGLVALNLSGWAFCQGESFPVPVPKPTTVTVPFSIF